ncbi:Oidioi.mRNA.OKI2018_I69.PAR.g8570.t1.cds [Oikopleura dioica]|uniref:Oidioi.mRNA.OKI2018_I69.PAR.g8570.t1.cds n=1 Tax=Oikopleura dioica TaxID=34765 RepID=A0ABN7RGJ5_OIKDI|nr:Oidioi.mRNA.OKI2018_I69.PAR.g8570.t1.cds [Oikopleura dioica]
MECPIGRDDCQKVFAAAQCEKCPPMCLACHKRSLPPHFRCPFCRQTMIARAIPSDLGSSVGGGARSLLDPPRFDTLVYLANEDEKNVEKIVENAVKEEKEKEDRELNELARELCENIIREVIDAAVSECEKKENEQAASDPEQATQDPVVNSSSPDAPAAAAAPVHDVRASYRFDAEEEAACDQEVDKLLNSTAGSSEMQESSQLMASEMNRGEPDNDDEERDAPVEDAPVSEVDQEEAVVEEAAAEESTVKEAPIEDQAPEPVAPVTQQTSRIWHRRRRGHFEARKLAQSRVDRQQTDQVNEEKEEVPPVSEEPVQDASPRFSLDARSTSGSTIGSCQSLAGSSQAPSEITLSNISIKSASACDSIPASLMPYKMKQIALLESELAIALEKSKKYEKEAEGYKAELNKYIALYGPLPSDSTPRAYPSESNNSES